MNTKTLSTLFDILNLLMTFIGYAITIVFLNVAIRESIRFWREKQWYKKRRKNG